MDGWEQLGRRLYFLDSGATEGEGAEEEEVEKNFVLMFWTFLYTASHKLNDLKIIVMRTWNHPETCDKCVKHLVLFICLFIY